MFEYFVIFAEKLLALIEANETMFLSFSFVNILSNWFIFKYHAEAIKSHKLFRDNIHILGRYCSTTYNMWRMCAMTFAPCGVFVLFYSLYTRFDTIEFMRLYGIRNAIYAWNFVKSLPPDRKNILDKRKDKTKAHKA